MTLAWRTRLTAVAVLAAAANSSLCRLSAQDMQSSASTLNKLSADEQTMVESACRTDRLVNGPSAYYRCVRKQLASLGTSTAPSLGGVTSDEQTMIESACRTDRLVNGPSAYYRCVRKQLASLGTNTAPSLGGVTSDEQTMIESACRTDRLVNGPSAYYRCVRQHLAWLGSITAPSLNGVSRDERMMIESACRTDRLVNGPSAYYACLRGQLKSLQSSDEDSLDVLSDHERSAGKVAAAPRRESTVDSRNHPDDTGADETLTAPTLKPNLGRNREEGHAPSTATAGRNSSKPSPSDPPSPEDASQASSLGTEQAKSDGQLTQGQSLKQEPPTSPGDFLVGFGALCFAWLAVSYKALPGTRHCRGTGIAGDRRKVTQSCRTPTSKPWRLLSRDSEECGDARKVPVLARPQVAEGRPEREDT